MRFEITCPYCFRKMMDNEVMFRSEKVNQGEPDFLPDDYDDIDDFRARYRGPNKDELLAKCDDWAFFAESTDPAYEAFWANFNGTSEYNPADAVLRVKAYHRRVIDPAKPSHQNYLQKQPDGGYFIYDERVWSPRLNSPPVKSATAVSAAIATTPCRRTTVRIL